MRVTYSISYLAYFYIYIKYHFNIPYWCFFLNILFCYCNCFKWSRLYLTFALKQYLCRFFTFINKNNNNKRSFELSDEYILRNIDFLRSLSNVKCREKIPSHVKPLGPREVVQLSMRTECVLPRGDCSWQSEEHLSSPQ